MDKELKRAYIAGLWDGDGSFGIAKRVHRILAYQPFALISLTDPKAEKIWELLEEVFDFKCIHTYLDPKHPRTKRVYRWMLHSQKASDFAREIEPYLIIKKERAQLLIDWPKKQYPQMNKTERDLITQRQKELYEKMRILNHRGND